MPSSSFTYPSADGTQIVTYQWDPAGEPRAAVQLTHGMGEHARRYEHVATALTDARYVVYAHDQRGHGASADPERLGDLGKGGWNALVDDIGLLSARIRAEHPGLPLILLGHSMGSFAVQQYLLDHSDDVDGVVLTGTAVIDLLEPALDLDQPLDLTMFNAPFQPARTDYDWLSRDDAVVDAYVADGALTVLTPLSDRLAAAGLADVTVVTYPEARHEVLNETNSDEVIASLIAWADRFAAAS